MCGVAFLRYEEPCMSAIFMDPPTFVVVVATRPHEDSALALRRLVFRVAVKELKLSYHYMSMKALGFKLP